MAGKEAGKMTVRFEVAVSVSYFHFLVRLRVLVSAIKAVPHSFLFDCLLAVLVPPGVAVRVWNTTAGGGDSDPCCCQNGDYLLTSSMSAWPMSISLDPSIL